MPERKTTSKAKASGAVKAKATTGEKERERAEAGQVDAPPATPTPRNAGTPAARSAARVLLSFLAPKNFGKNSPNSDDSTVIAAGPDMGVLNIHVVAAEEGNVEVTVKASGMCGGRGDSRRNTIRCLATEEEVAAVISGVVPEL